MAISKAVPILSKVLVSVALCLATTPAYSAACQGQGCVLPITDAPPPPVETAFVEERGGIGLLPILIGLGVLAAALYFLVLDDDDDEEDLPASP